MNSLMHRLSNVKMLQVDYWTPSRSIDFIINKISYLINKWGIIETNNDLNDIICNPNGAYYKLEDTLIKLATLCNNNDQFEELDDDTYIKINSNANDTEKNSSKNYWVSGTGYGHSGQQKWDINKYLEVQKEKDTKKKNVLIEILSSLKSIGSDNILNILTGSYLIQFIISYLNGTTLLEINKHNDIYSNIFDIIKEVINKNSISIFFNNEEKIVNIFKNLNDSIVSIEKFKHSEFDNDLVESIKLINLKFQEEISKNKKEINQPNNDKEIKSEDIKEIYKNTMKKYNFDTKTISTDSSYYYFKNINNKNNFFTKKYKKRIVKEWQSLMDPPIHYESSIFIRVDDSSMSCMRALITGPDNTPYDSGCFIFDIYMPSDFPSVPPKVWFMNHGGVRFNPNLYDYGKVCLSLLGTWSGNKGESWIENLSTLIQVFISIQSLILIEDPYFNEPGYEREKNTTTGTKKSDSYNSKIRLYTMKHAMLGLLKKPYIGFENVIKNHFALKKYIKETVEKWVSDSKKYTSSIHDNYIKTRDELFNELDKL